MRSLSNISFNKSASNLVFYKSLLYAILLFMVLTITYRVFLNSILYYVQLAAEALFEAFLLVYIAGRIVNRVFTQNYRINHLEVYLFILMLLPIIPAIGAYQRFGQPLIYGLGSFRDYYLMFGCLVIYNLLRSNKVTIEMVEQAFVRLAWVQLFFCYFMTFFTNPAKYQDTGLAGANEMKGGEVYYRFNMAMFFFGSVYYTVKSFYQRKYFYLVYAGLFLAYILFLRQDRTTIIAALAAIGLFAVTGLGYRAQVLTFVRFFIPVLLLSGIMALAFPQVVSKYSVMFGDAFATVTGTKAEQASESVRLAELKIALEGIRDKPIFGNGKVSNKWIDGGYNAFYKFFYASDVGIFGQVYMYGFIGAFILYAQFLFGLFFAWRIKYIRMNVFLVTMKCVLFAHALDSLSNGYLTIYSAQTMTAVMLIYYFYQKDRVVAAERRLQKFQKEQKLHHEAQAYALP